MLPTAYFEMLNEWASSTFPAWLYSPSLVLLAATGALLMFATFSAFGGLMILRGIHLTIYKKKKR